MKVVDVERFYFEAFLSENWQPVSCRLARESRWFIVLHDAHAWKQRCIWSSNKEQRGFARNSCCFSFLSKHFSALLVQSEQSEQIGLILNETRCFCEMLFFLLLLLLFLFFFCLVFYFWFSFLVLNRFCCLLMTLLFNIMLMLLCLWL